MEMEEKANPNSWGNCLEQGTATSSWSLRAALRRSASNETYTVYRSRIPVRVSHMASPGMQRPGQWPTAQQDWEHSMAVPAALGEQGPALPLLCETEPSQELETRSPVGSRTSQETYVVYRSCIPVQVSRMVSTGLQRPSQQQTEEQDRAHGRPVSAPLGTLPETWCHRQVTEQDPAVSCVQMGRQNLSGTSLPLPAKPAENLSTLSQRKHPQELNTRHPACAEHTLPLLRETSPVLQKLEEMPSDQRVLDWLEANFPNEEEDQRAVPKGM